MDAEEEFKLSQVNGNKNDPLKNADEARRELFNRLSKQAAGGFTQRDVVYAAANLILNAIRQSCSTQKAAEKMFDEMMGHAKRTLLDQHYFPSGSRRNVYPYHQIIEPDVVDARGKVF